MKNSRLILFIFSIVIPLSVFPLPKYVVIQNGSLPEDLRGILDLHGMEMKRILSDPTFGELRFFLNRTLETSVTDRFVVFVVGDFVSYGGSIYFMCSDSRREYLRGTAVPLSEISSVFPRNGTLVVLVGKGKIDATAMRRLSWKGIGSAFIPVEDFEIFLRGLSEEADLDGNGVVMVSEMARYMSKSSMGFTAFLPIDFELSLTTLELLQRSFSKLLREFSRSRITMDEFLKVVEVMARGVRGEIDVDPILLYALGDVSTAELLRSLGIDR